MHQHRNNIVIAPSLLAAHFGRLISESARAQRARGDWLHLDIMDGHFVPNISFGPAVVRALRPACKLFFDVHLMCSKPEVVIEAFVRAGANHLTVHAELGETKVAQLLWKIRSLGAKAGLAVNPPTAMSLALPHLNRIDLLLVMTVNPGFGGQEFIVETLPKIQQAAAWRAQKQLRYRIEVDGGIDSRTIGDCAKAGADTFVSGTALFSKRQMGAAIKKLRQLARENAANDPPLDPLPEEAVEPAGA